jgi:SAM-dependent methyltransferase
MSSGVNDKPVGSESYSEAYYQESCGGGEFFRAYRAEILKPQLAHALRRGQVTPGMQVLDLGCGRGELLHHLRRLGARAIGTDYAAAALPLAQEVSGCPVVRCDAKALPFAENQFDRVFLLGVVDHLHDWELETCFKDLARILRPGGQVLVHTCTNRLYYKNWTYRVRVALAHLLGRRMPAPPRTGEDEELHINEHSLGDLQKFFRGLGWRCDVEPLPNYKCLVTELYGASRPEGFPLRAASPLKSAISRALLKFPGLRSILAREFLCVLTPPNA